MTSTGRQSVCSRLIGGFLSMLVLAILLACNSGKGTLLGKWVDASDGVIEFLGNDTVVARGQAAKWSIKDDLLTIEGPLETKVFRVAIKGKDELELDQIGTKKNPETLWRAETSAYCSAKKACTEFGRCTFSGGKCQVGSDADCQRLTACATSGLCSAVDGQCRAGKDADCTRTAVCTSEGKCSAVGGFCRVGKDSDCAPTKGCTEDGLCSFVNGGCGIGGKDENCRRGQNCKLRGHCAADGNDCVASSDADCAESQGCADHGKCGLTKDLANKGTRTCAPRSEADCLNSRMCKLAGHCSRGEAPLNPVDCHPTTDAQCEQSQYCRTTGECASVSWAGGTMRLCKPTTPAHCAESEKCRTEKKGCLLQQMNWGPQCMPI